MIRSRTVARFQLTALVALAVLSAPALAADVVLLPNGLMTPTTKEQTKEDQFKKAPPWRIGVSFGGVGNTWIVQMIQEMKYAAAQNKNIGEFIFVEANWQAAKQVADVRSMIAQKVDAIFLAQHNGSGAYTRLMGQRGLNLSQLHPKPPNLHLVIGASQPVERAVCAKARDVTGGIDALSRRGGQGDEVLPG